MVGGQREDPLPKFRYHVEIDSMVVGGFSEVRGLSMAIDEPERAESDDRPIWKRVFGFGGSEDRGSATKTMHGRRLATNSPTLKLRRGVTEDTALWQWYEEWLTGAGERRTVRVILLDENGREARGWECRNARPVRWVGPTLIAGESGVALETFELEHEGIWLVEGL